MTPQKATLDSLLTLSWFISYWRLAPKFHHSLSAFTLGIYLGGFYMSPYQSRNKEGTDCHTELGLLRLSAFCSEVKFLDEIQTKVLRVFLLAIHSHLYTALPWDFYSSSNSHNLLQFLQFITAQCKGERKKTWWLKLDFVKEVLVRPVGSSATLTSSQPIMWRVQVLQYLPAAEINGLQLSGLYPSSLLLQAFITK